MKKRYLFFGALLLNAFGAQSQIHMPPCDPLQNAELVHGGCNGNDFILVFEDEFEEPSLNKKTWGLKWPPGAAYYNLAEPVQEYNTYENVSINNGVATITAKPEGGYRIQAPGNLPNSNFGTDGAPNERVYYFTSSSLWSNYVFGSGYFEIKCKVPDVAGYWPAFWLFNGTQDMGFDDPELDIFEFWDNNDNDVNLTIHNDNKMCGEEHFVEPDEQGWYTIGAYWDDWKIIWMVNGIAVQSTYRIYIPTPSGLTGLECEIAEPFIVPGVAGFVNEAFPTTPMQLIFNLAVRRETEFLEANPVTMDVDYIRFYQQRWHCDTEKTFTTTASLGLDNDVSIMQGLGKPYYHHETGSIINLEGNITLLSNIGPTYAPIPQQLKFTASEEMNFNLDPNGLPISNSSVVFDIQPEAIFEAVIDPNVCSNTPYNMPMNTTQDMLTEFDTNGIGDFGVLDLENENPVADGVFISPNPTNGDVVTVSSPQKSKVVFMNAQGMKVKEMEVQAGSNQLNVQDLKSGVYHLYFESLKEAIKFVKL